MRYSPFRTLACAIPLALIDWPVTAQEAGPPPASQTEATTTPSWQSIIVPNTQDIAELEQFIEATKKRQPLTAEQYIEMQRALRSAAKSILESIKDRKSPSFQRAEAEFVNASVMLLGNEGPDSQRKTFERFRDYLQERESIEFSDLQMAILAGNNLEQLQDYSLAKEAYTTFAKILREKKKDELAGVIALLDANVRRLELPGNLFHLESQTLSGEEFNVESLQGKYVLIYFWASTTRACSLEHPYLVSVYNKYKERGFEIVAIGLDDHKAAAQAFIEQHPMPWINLWDNRKNGISEVMENYGVSAIPSLFLLDQQGKVITIEARGQLLGKALEKLLPDPSSSTSSSPPGAPATKPE